MKKFTISFFVAIIFVTASMLGCFSVSAQEQELTASITVEEFMELDAEVAASSYVTIGSDKEYTFYDQLDDNNKSAYDLIAANWTTPNLETLTYSLTDTISYQASSIDTSTWTEEQTAEFWGLVFSAFQSGETVFMYDYPEVFWYERKDLAISIGYSTSYSSRKKLYTITVNKIQITPSLRSVFADEEEALNAQNYLVQQIEDLEVEGHDYYTKIKYIHDYISNAVTYSFDTPYLDTAYGMFAEPYQFVCEGYAEAFKMLCDKEGIPCISIVGNFDAATNMAHMWNYVKMEDNKWYGVDVTWDDLDDQSNPVKYEYFLKGSENFLSEHTPDDDYMTPGFVYPELSSTDYVYSVDEPVVTTAATTPAVTTVTTASVATTSETSSSSGVTTVTTAKTTTSSSKITTGKNTTTTAATTVTTEPSVTTLKGDFNRNGSVDIADVVTLQKKLTNQIAIEVIDYEYETYIDSRLNVWDYVVLLRSFLL